MNEVMQRERAAVQPSSVPGADAVLTPAAIEFLGELHERFNDRRLALLDKRVERQRRLDAGELPDFPEDTREIRDADWKIGGIPADLRDRRVEITGPTNAKMVINALNSGAQVFMADFEDATSPVWDELVQGQVNLGNHWLGALDFTDAATGKNYVVGDQPAVLMVRPRGWHLPEAHVTVAGEPVSGGAVRFRPLFLAQRRASARARVRAPISICPNWRASEEAALWSDVFAFARRASSAWRGARSRRRC